MTFKLSWIQNVLGILACTVITVSCSKLDAPVSAPGLESLRLQALTTYFVDNRSGSSCSNAGTGTSSSAPWCDFTPVNSRTYGPGDQILLARGEWLGEE